MEYLGLAGIEVLPVRFYGGLDHLIGAVDRSDAAGVEAFAYEADPVAVAAAYFKDLIVRADR